MRHEYDNNEKPAEEPRDDGDGNAKPKTVWYYEHILPPYNRIDIVPNSCRAYRILHFEKCATQPGICINLLWNENGFNPLYVVVRTR